MYRKITLNLSLASLLQRLRGAGDTWLKHRTPM